MLSAGPALGQRGTSLAHAERVRRVARRLAHEHVNGRQRADHGHIVRSCAPRCDGQAGGGHCPAPRYTAIRAGVVERCPRAGAAPEAATRGSADLSVDDATRARTAMRLYGRQSRVRARRRRVLLSLGVVLALVAIPLGHLVLQRGAVVHGVRVAGVPLGGASRAQAEREITAAVGDQLQRDVTVNVAGRSATLSPYDLGVRVDAARTAQAALDSGRVRGGLLFSLAYSRAIAPVLRYPEATRAAGGARERDAALRSMRDWCSSRAGPPSPCPPRPVSASIPPRPCGRSRAPRSPIAATCRCAPCPRPLRSRPRPRAAPRPGSRCCCRSRSPSPAAARLQAAGPCGGSRHCSPRRPTST